MLAEVGCLSSPGMKDKCRQALGVGESRSHYATDAHVCGRSLVLQAGVESGNVHSFNAPKAAA